MKHLLSGILIAITISLQAHPGIGFIYDGDQTIYYTDLKHIWQVNTLSGESQIFIEDVHSHEIVMDSLGAIYGEHYWYNESQVLFKNYVWKKEKSGQYFKVRADQEGENDDFSFVRDENFSGYLITDFGDAYHIIKSTGGQEEILWKGSLNRPTWKALDQKGRLLFVDYPGVYRLNSGKLDTLASDLSKSRLPFSVQRDDHHIYGIWTDPSNNIYVAIFGARSIIKIDDSSDKPQEIYKSDFFWSPVNGLFDKEGNLWVLEATMTGNVRVEKADINSNNGSVTFWIVIVVIGLVGSMALIRIVKNRKSQRLNSVV